MTRIKLRYVNSYVDRTGKRRFYVRRRGLPSITLPGLPGSVEFMEAYQQALDGERVLALKDRGAPPGTSDRLLQDYFQPTNFLGNELSSQRAYRRVFERWVRDDKIGHRRGRSNEAPARAGNDSAPSIQTRIGK